MTGMFTCILYKNNHVKGYSILKYVHLTTFIREKESKGSCAWCNQSVKGWYTDKGGVKVLVKKGGTKQQMVS